MINKKDQEIDKTSNQKKQKNKKKLEKNKYFVECLITILKSSNLSDDEKNSILMKLGFGRSVNSESVISADMESDFRCVSDTSIIDNLIVIFSKIPEFNKLFNNYRNSSLSHNKDSLSILTKYLRDIIQISIESCVLSSENGIRLLNCYTNYINGLAENNLNHNHTFRKLIQYIQKCLQKKDFNNKCKNTNEFKSSLTTNVKLKTINSDKCNAQRQTNNHIDFPIQSIQKSISSSSKYHEKPFLPRKEQPLKKNTQIFFGINSQSTNIQNLEDDSTLNELSDEDQNQLTHLRSSYKIHPTSLIKLFIRSGNNSKKVTYLISNHQTKIPNQTSISEIRKQIQELSKVHYSTKGRVDIDIITKLFILFDENNLQVKAILENPFSKLPPLCPFSLSKSIHSLQNVDFYYFHYLPQIYQNSIINLAENNQNGSDLASIIHGFRKRQLEQLIQSE